MKVVPIDSPECGESIGTTFVRIGILCEKLWANKISLSQTILLGVEGSKKLIKNYFEGGVENN